jgi:hypothetical protein
MIVDGAAHRSECPDLPLRLPRPPLPVAATSGRSYSRSAQAPDLPGLATALRASPSQTGYVRASLGRRCCVRSRCFDSCRAGTATCGDEIPNSGADGFILARTAADSEGLCSSEGQPEAD